MCATSDRRRRGSPSPGAATPAAVPVRYVGGAANEEITAARNARDLDAMDLAQRVTIDAGGVATGVTLLGQDLAMPVVLGPVGLAGLWRDAATGRRTLVC